MWISSQEFYFTIREFLDSVFDYSFAGKISMNKAYITIFLLTQVMCFLLYLDQDYLTYVLTVLFGTKLPFVKKVVS